VTETARWRTRILDRLHARRAGWAPAGSGLLRMPDPRGEGSADRGREITEGRTVRLGGSVIRTADRSIWRLASPGAEFEEARQSFDWLDDLGAYGESAARRRAQEWTGEWIDRFGRGQGPGWTALLAARRVRRLIDHRRWLGSGPQPLPAAVQEAMLERHLRFLVRRATAAAPGQERIEVLVGLIEGGLLLGGMGWAAETAVAALEDEARTAIDPAGAIPARNPEELATIFVLLARARQALAEAGRDAGEQHLAALTRAARSLRSLRHVDGHLPRFHGGGRGDPAALDQALLSIPARTGRAETAMGFARLARGRITVIIDAETPPLGHAPTTAHASTLGFEMTSGRRPLIVSCGSGRSFGPDWWRAARATPSHSTLAIDGQSSSRVSRKKPDTMTEGPRHVQLDVDNEGGNAVLVAGHDGYARTHGLIHARRLELSEDGRSLSGEDVLSSVTDEDQHRFERALIRARSRHNVVPGLPFNIRFHLHPEVSAAMQPDGRSVLLALRNGERWIFRDGSNATIRLDPSVYLDKTAREPIATLQIVLSHRATGFETTVHWSLAKTGDTPDFVRDLERDDPFVIE
jgi:uncharacterized heparinase superfamily protein